MVFALRIRGSANAEEYISEGVAVGVHNSDELFTLLQELLSRDRENKEFQIKSTKKYVFQSENYASEIVANLAEKLIDEKRD